MEAPSVKQPSELVARPVPLVVDLDAALAASDLLTESLFVLAKRRPRRLLMVPFWLAQGRAHLEHQLARQARPDLGTLPYHRDLLAYLGEEKRRGASLVLVTAADPDLAEDVAREVGLFDRVVASDGATRRSEDQKRDDLVARFGARGFDYVGAGGPDCPVWPAARRAILMRPGPGVAAGVAEVTEVERVFADRAPRLRTYLRAVRPRQWLKNALVFVPLVAANRLDEAGLLLLAFLAFVAFSLCASSAYLLNDLMDLPSDRRHPDKRARPVASGELSATRAALLVPLLLTAAGAVGLLLPPAFLGVLALYYALTLAYSLRLKDVVILDVLALAGLHALRVLAGSAAVAIAPSHWLLAFCVFLFFSLALIKRYAELVVMRALEGANAHARAYRLEDSELLAALGGASGYIAVLVLALYISSDTAHGLYPRQELIWLICVLLLYWISYMWLIAHRARMRDDPLVFAVHDRVSLVLIALMAAVLVAAAVP